MSHVQDAPWHGVKRQLGHELEDLTLLWQVGIDKRDLARSPFHGEGHRKVHARLRILDGIRVARTRVLRVMRAHGLLSPHRGRQGAAKTHDGKVITQAPNVMWGTDGVRVFTLDGLSHPCHAHLTVLPRIEHDLPEQPHVGHIRLKPFQQRDERGLQSPVLNT